MSNHGSHLLADSGSAQTHTRYSKFSFFLAAKIPNETGSHTAAFLSVLSKF